VKIVVVGQHSQRFGDILLVRETQPQGAATLTCVSEIELSTPELVPVRDRA
jgi:hypothetical protein